MIAPIANDFGAKFKVAEAISFARPLLATESAMSGVSFLPWLPRIDLEDPVAAAQTAFELIHDPARLIQTSQCIHDDASRHREVQATAWSTIIGRVVKRKGQTTRTGIAGH